MKDFRVHLNTREIRALLEVVKYAEDYLDIQEKELKRMERRLYSLRQELKRGNTTLEVIREVKTLKEKLGGLQSFSSTLLQRRMMCNSLRRRLESILRGGKAHRHWTYVFNLERVVS